MNNDLKRELILENFNNPYHKGLLDEEGYIYENSSSTSCIDNFKIGIKIKDDIIDDIRYDGEACAIATSSISISVSKLIGKTIEEALNIIDNYEKMINEEEYDKDILEELIIYEDINKQPSRVKCATLGIEGIKNILKNYKK